MTSKKKDNVEERSEEDRVPLEKELPPADFLALISLFQLPALQFLGELNGPSSEQKQEIHPEMAKYYIDCLSILDEKTRGNLEDEEKKALDNVLVQLRLIYVKKAPRGGTEGS